MPIDGQRGKYFPRSTELTMIDRVGKTDSDAGRRGIFYNSILPVDFSDGERRELGTAVSVIERPFPFPPLVLAFVGSLVGLFTRQTGRQRRLGVRPARPHSGVRGRDRQVQVRGQQSMPCFSGSVFGFLVSGLVSFVDNMRWFLYPIHCCRQLSFPRRRLCMESVSYHLQERAASLLHAGRGA